jgi:hypothetical protein
MSLNKGPVKIPPCILALNGITQISLNNSASTDTTWTYQSSLHVLKFGAATHKFCIIKINESIKRTEFSCELPYFPVFTRIT